MSDPVIQEPLTSGRVKLRTTKGDLYVELWSREAPLACRNFVQLCKEGYYNGTIFHRIVRDFLVQSGDPTGTGTTCESIYAEPFPDEINPRLRFRYRGMVGVANAGKGTNGSQFFITLSAQEGLTGKSTLFGRVVQDSIYTLVDISEVEVDSNDRPSSESPPRILESIVLEDPFPEIVPRQVKPAFDLVTQTAPQKKRQVIQARRTNLLSFEDEEEGDEIDGLKSGEGITIMSAHDVLKSDKTLSSECVAVPATRTSQMARATFLEFEEKVGAKIEAKIHSEEPSYECASENSDSILAEIARVEEQIKALSNPSSAAEKSKPKTRPDELSANRRKDNDDGVVKKLKGWADRLSKSSGRQPSEEGAEAVSGSNWLEGVGRVKFAVDSKRAFS